MVLRYKDYYTVINHIYGLEYTIIMVIDKTIFMVYNDCILIKGELYDFIRSAVYMVGQT